MVFLSLTDTHFYLSALHISEFKDVPNIHIALLC